ncbi:MAG: hypothetical protein FWG92_04355, partial [Leptospirales bacterium]|nr:hypothetical protein [Leptospirales bacterium]
MTKFKNENNLPELSEDFLLYEEKYPEEKFFEEETQGEKLEKKSKKEPEKETSDAADDLTITLSENPYSANGKQTSDIVRLFYINDIPIIPVVSKRGVLLGILKKDDVIAELSDLDRSAK